jgi:hypothetical protein
VDTIVEAMVAATVVDMIVVVMVAAVANKVTVEDRADREVVKVMARVDATVKAADMDKAAADRVVVKVPDRDRVTVMARAAVRVPVKACKATRCRINTCTRNSTVMAVVAVWDRVDSTIHNVLLSQFLLQHQRHQHLLRHQRLHQLLSKQLRDSGHLLASYP